jgi:WXG100 family type VII secretion target
MPAAIEVQPERLRHAAAATRALAARLRSLRGSLDGGRAGLDAGVGGVEAGAALADFWIRWSASAERLVTATDELAATLQAAAAGYERTDRQAARTPVDKEGGHASAR